MKLNHQKYMPKALTSVVALLFASTASAQLYTENFDSYTSIWSSGGFPTPSASNHLNVQDSGALLGRGWVGVGMSNRILEDGSEEEDRGSRTFITDALGSGSNSITARNEGIWAANGGTSASLRHFLNDRTGIQDGLGGTHNVTGSIGSVLSQSSPYNGQAGFSFDLLWGVTSLKNGPVMEFKNDLGSTIMRLDLRNSGGVNTQLRVLQASGTHVTFAPDLTPDTWYNLSISNLNFTTSTDVRYDVTLRDASGSIVASAQDLTQWNDSISSISELSFSEAGVENSYLQVDNFTIVPEPSMAALLMGAFALTGVVLVRRRRD